MSPASCLRLLAILSLLLVPGDVQAQAPNIPRPEHPRPDFMRAEWQTLNGRWDFEFDDSDRGLSERWYSGARRFSGFIQVPYCFQSKLSGIADTAFHDVIWYRRSIEIPATWRSRRVLLNFGAIDYEATVWVNGAQAGFHRGGHVPFAVDITDHLKARDNEIIVRAWDPSVDLTLPRGKQYWQPRSQSIWYTRTSGIWQPVWLEAVDSVRVTRLRITPDVDQSQASIEAALTRSVPDLKLRVTARLGDIVQAQSEVICRNARPVAAIKLVARRPTTAAPGIECAVRHIDQPNRQHQ